MRELADLVAVRYGGALKGEHSTGRNMAPFLELEWGEEAVARHARGEGASSIPRASSTPGS